MTGTGRGATFRLPALVLAAPILAILTGITLRARYDADWEAALVAHFGPLTPVQLARYPFGTACADPVMQGDAACTAYGNLGLLVAGAVMGAVLGLLLIGYVRWIGRRADGEPSPLAASFRRAVRITVLGISALVLVDAGITVGALYYGIAFVTGYVYPYVLVLVGAAGLIGGLTMARTALTFAEPASTSVFGREVRRR